MMFIATFPIKLAIYFLVNEVGICVDNLLVCLLTLLHCKLNKFANTFGVSGFKFHFFL